MDKEIQSLLSLLDKAAAEMISYGDKSTLTFFDSCADVGNYIKETADRVRGGELEEISKLWYIFAPTGVWDDSSGSQEIANEIFEIINKNYQPDENIDS
ncbi:MAG: hypothetical protein ACTSQF_00710 [Candidatus Heimdallarchaeaceae archaeon]